MAPRLGPPLEPRRRGPERALPGERPSRLASGARTTPTARPGPLGPLRPSRTSAPSPLPEPRAPPRPPRAGLQPSEAISPKPVPQPRTDPAAPPYFAVEPDRPATDRPATDRTAGAGRSPELPTDRDPATAKAFVDFQNDVTAKDIRLAVREGFRSIEHVKRYTTNGMATDQGSCRTWAACSSPPTRSASRPPAVGLTTFRPPYTPTTFGAFAGHHRGGHFEAVRKTPIDAWAEAQDAVFEPVAQWRRARYFPRAGEDMDAGRRPRVPRHPRLAWDLRRLHPGQDRGRRTGCGRVHEPHVHQPVDQARARPMPLRPAARRRRLHPRRRRDRAPRGRPLPRHHHHGRRRAGPDHDGGLPPDRVARPQGLAHLDHRAVGHGRPQRPARARRPRPARGRASTSPRTPSPTCPSRVPPWRGSPARLFRISFTGELGFEVNVPARHGLRLWEALLEAGARPRRHAPTAPRRCT